MTASWTANNLTTELLPPDHANAYWGIAYVNYFGGTKRVFRCPSARVVDEWREDGRRFPSDWWLDSSYGINRYVGVDYKTESPRRTSLVQSPTTTVFAQDAAEQRMEGPDDSLGLFPGKTENLTQWKYDLASLYPGRRMEYEWYRHVRKCNTLWIPGNVSSIRQSKGVDYRWYTGDTPIQSPGF